MNTYLCVAEDDKGDDDNVDGDRNMKQNWEAGWVSEVIAVQAWGTEFNPQHSCESRAQWCALVTPALGKQRQENPKSWLDSLAELVSSRLWVMLSPN